jgi:MoaA/NifB/PqqE/SkfB family radical SAM enzyme
MSVSLESVATAQPRLAFGRHNAKTRHPPHRVLALDDDLIEAYDLSRNFAGKAVRAMCYAPYTNLSFDAQGRVKACGWSWSHPVGNIRTQTLDEIWAGARVLAMRRAMESYEFSPGCTFCESQTREGWPANAVMRSFDQFSVSAPDPRWPQCMEFAIANTCELECVMCSGLFSSAIRARRERLAPLPSAYPSDFVDSLRKYLPHLASARFDGGEPFLIEDYYRIWEWMADEAPRVKCQVTTAGTVFNSRIEALLDRLDFGFAVSMDGTTQQTVESIRVHTNFHSQRAILQRLLAYTRERKTTLALKFCLMRQNWQEFGDFCLLADAWDCSVGVNVIRDPPQFSLDTLPAPELRGILDAMERQAVSLDSQLVRNRRAWLEQLDRLRQRYARLCG